jgi:IS605 OrfB family transposase
MIAQNHGVIVIEDLKVVAMTKSGKGTLENPGKLVQKQANQNRSLLDVSPRMIRTMLEYKAPWYGSRIIVVDAASRISRSASSAPTAAASSTPMSTRQRTYSN